jgi:ABC-type molybdate transport system permease subunit
MALLPSSIFQTAFQCPSHDLAKCESYRTKYDNLATPLLFLILIAPVVAGYALLIVIDRQINRAAKSP